MRDDVRAALSVLGVGDSPTYGEVRAAYRRLCKVWHPDRFRDNAELQEQAAEKLRQANEAYTLASAFLLHPESLPAEPRPRVAFRKELAVALGVLTGVLLLAVALTVVASFVQPGLRGARTTAVSSADAASFLATVSPAPGRFFLGSSEDDVRKVMGAPDVRNGRGDAEGTYDSSWQYGSRYGGRVFFKDGKVVGYSDRDAVVRLRVGTTVLRDPSSSMVVAPGDTLSVVIAKLGTPQVAWLPLTGAQGKTANALLRYYGAAQGLADKPVEIVLDVVLAPNGTVLSAN